MCTTCKFALLCPSSFSFLTRRLSSEWVEIILIYWNSFYGWRWLAWNERNIVFVSLVTHPAQRATCTSSFMWLCKCQHQQQGTCGSLQSNWCEVGPARGCFVRPTFCTCSAFPSWGVLWLSLITHTHTHTHTQIHTHYTHIHTHSHSHTLT